MEFLLKSISATEHITIKFTKTYKYDNFLVTLL